MSIPNSKGALFARTLRIYFICLCAVSPSLYAATSTLKPTEDAYVQNGTNASKNFGSATELRIGTSSTTANNYDSYLKFDALAISGSINSAKLRIYAKLSTSGTVSTTAYAVSNTTWAFNTITWNNKPTRGTSLGSVTVNSTSYSFKEIDVTNYVKSEFAAGRKLLSFAYHNGANSTPYITARSINSTNNQPELVIDAGPANVPPTVSLAGPASGASFTAPANISLSANAADIDGTIASVAYYNGTTLVATGATAAPYSATWSNVPAGTYTLTARATDNGGAVTTSSPITITVTALPVSSVTLTPTADAYVVGGSSTNYGSNAELRIRSSSTTSSNYDAYLKFDGSAVAGTVSSAKLRIYTRLSASGTISTTVYAVSNTSWAENTINGTNRPARGASLGSVTVNSTSYSYKEIDVTNYVKSEFAAGRRVLSFTYHNGANTSNYITANSKEATNKPQLLITTPINAAPTVSLASPTSGATFNAPANIALSANAADSDGSITKVEYFNGATPVAIGSATPPYAATWTNVPAGSYSLTARATDNGGVTTTSSAVSVTAVVSDTQGPAISLLAPADQSILPADAIPTISAAYSDTGSGINLATAKLTVDGIDVTASAVTTLTGISYTPAQALAEGAHTVQLAIADGSGNISQASWTFTTRSAPQIKNTSPPDQQNITDPLTPISASLSDVGAGVDPSRSVLAIDGVPASGVQSNTASLRFTPTASWSTGTHAVNLTIYDLAGNSASSAWSFIYDPAPAIYDETPRDVFVAVPNPLIRVLLRDLGNGINLAATTLKLDGADVSTQASITATEIRYAPTALSDGVHTLTVQTQSNTGKIASKQWQFTVLTPPAPPVDEDGVRTAPVFNMQVPLPQ